MAAKKTTPPRPSPLLDLDTFATRAFVRIDGQAYDVRNYHELPVLDCRRVDHWQAQINALLLTDDPATEPAPEQAEELSRLFDAFCRKVLDAPLEVHAKLTDVQRMAILAAFLELRNPTRPSAGAPPTLAAMAPSTGAISAPA